MRDIICCNSGVAFKPQSLGSGVTNLSERI
nr:MAG TPA: hypothetical protein [Caudoviricetes sp.]DAE81548.1 MAG TPA: hypothetical protein [Caudoviricetes sp.]